MREKLALACLDDDTFYLTMIRDLLTGVVGRIELFSHHEELISLKDEELAEFHVIILDFDLGGKTVVEIGLPAYLRQKKNYKGKLILFSLLEEFGPDQDYIDKWFSGVLNKDKIDQDSMLEAIRP